LFQYYWDNRWTAGFLAEGKPGGGGSQKIPRHRIEENLKVFDINLSPEEVEALSEMEGKLGIL